MTDTNFFEEFDFLETGDEITYRNNQYIVKKVSTETVTCESDDGGWQLEIQPSYGPYSHGFVVAEYEILEPDPAKVKKREERKRLGDWSIRAERRWQNNHRPLRDYRQIKQ